MKKSIELHRRKINYTLKVSKRAKRMRLAVYCDGSCVVTVPQTLPEAIIERFIIKKSQWLIDKILYFKSVQKSNIGKIENHEDYIKYKNKALLLVADRLAHFNTMYGYSWNKVTIKNQKTRWGSCSRKGNLNFNYKIALLPSKLTDYIVVHELCHLKEFNHSKKFWNLVAVALPDYASIRDELKKNNLSVS